MQVDQEGHGDQQVDDNSPSSKVSCAFRDQKFNLMLVQSYDMYST